MGSYRRGQETSGDVDILITRDTADGLNHSLVLKALTDRLKTRGIITHDVGCDKYGKARVDLQLGVPHDWRGLEAKWMGVGRLNSDSKYRRIGELPLVKGALNERDILCIPFEQWGAALIYFTGWCHPQVSVAALTWCRKRDCMALLQDGADSQVQQEPSTLRSEKGVQSESAGPFDWSHTGQARPENDRRLVTLFAMH